MSSLGLITQQAERDGVSAPTVERDYVLAHIIAGLGSLGSDHGLVFRVVRFRTLSWSNAPSLGACAGST